MTATNVSFVRQLGRELSTVRGTAGLRKLCLALLAAGSGVSVLFALVPVLIVTELGADTRDVGLYISLVTLASIPMALLTGHWSERISRPHRLAVALTCWTGCGFVAVGLAPGYPALIVAGLLFMTLLDSSNAQLLASSRLAVSRLSPASETATMSTVRSAYSLGYVAGPLAAAVLLAVLDVRTALVVSGCVYVTSALVYRSVPSRDRAPRRAEAADRGPRPTGPGRPLALTATGLALVFVAPVLRAAFLLLYATGELGIPLDRMVVVLAIAPLAEFVLMPAAGVAADRWGCRTVVLAGGALAAVEMSLLALSTELWQLAALQLVGAGVLACAVGVGMTYAQDLAPARTRFGTSVFLAARAAGGVIGSGAGGLAAHALGFQGMFAAGAVLAGAGTALVAAAQPRRLRQPSAPGKPVPTP